jgi:hypothetical protein
MTWFRGYKSALFFFEIFLPWIASIDRYIIYSGLSIFLNGIFFIKIACTFCLLLIIRFHTALLILLFFKCMFIEFGLMTLFSAPMKFIFLSTKITA